MLIADPCKAPLGNVRFLSSSSGYISRFKKDGIGAFHTLGSAETTLSGYIAWFPGYHCPAYTGTADRGLSCFGWLSNSSSTGPANSTTYCYGGATSASTRAVLDPVYNFLAGNTAATARTLAACLQLRYIGTTSSCAGEYVVLPNVSADTLLTAQASVDQLFALADTVNRMSLAPIDVIYRPSDDDALQRTEGVSAVNGIQDKPIQSGADGASASTLGLNPPHQRAIVIAFRGVQQPSSDTMDVLVASTTKVVEWIPQSGSGINLSSVHAPAPTIDASTNKLDKALPNWQSPTPGKSAMERVGDMALAGVEYVADAAVDELEDLLKKRLTKLLPW
jgi:hypothetical protein